MTVFTLETFPWEVNLQPIFLLIENLLCEVQQKDLKVILDKNVTAYLASFSFDKHFRRRFFGTDALYSSVSCDLVFMIFHSTLLTRLNIGKNIDFDRLKNTSPSLVKMLSYSILIGCDRRKVAIELNKLAHVE